MSEGVMFGNLKDIARTNRAKNSGPATGNYQGKLVSLTFDALTDGRKEVVSEWLAIQAYGANEDATLDDCIKSVGKKMLLKFILQGKGSEFGMQKFATHLEEICRTTGHDLGQYQTEKDMKQLFLELNAHTVIREICGKWGKDKDGNRTAWKNWYIKKDRNAPAQPAQPAPAAGNANWTQQAPPAAPAPAPVAPPPAQPAPEPAQAPQPAAAPSAAAALFGGE